MEVENQLSYSSAQLVVNCEQRYYHYKIAKTPNDPDYEEDYEAFNIGLAFHRVLEKNKHTKNDLKTLIPLACQEFKIPDKVPLIHAMILKYLELHYKTGLTCISTEFQIIDEIFIGFVDALMIDKNKKWWIVDLKTAARQDEFLLPKLVLDTQLNLYAGYAPKIAELFNLKLKDFAGARYRTTTKTSISRRKGESYVDFVSRMKAAITSKDIVIPKEKMRVNEIADLHVRLHNRTMDLRRGKHLPMKNFSYCFSYFRPCPYFSKCHGMTVSEAKGVFKCHSN